MAPRKPKSTDDDASSTTSELPPVLKPKTEKAKVEKVKSEKPKTAKPKAVKKEKDGEKVEKAKKDGDGSGGGVSIKKAGEKEKVKAVNGEEAVEIMVRYLTEQNRPYSATEVSANLHGKVSFFPLSFPLAYLFRCGFRIGARMDDASNLPRANGGP
jgi:hypothetical protein